MSTPFTIDISSADEVALRDALVEVIQPRLDAGIHALRTGNGSVRGWAHDIAEHVLGALVEAPPPGRSTDLTPRDLIAEFIKGFGTDTEYRAADRLIGVLWDAGYEVVERADLMSAATNDDLRERIAQALATLHVETALADNGHRPQYVQMADAVLDALGLKQVVAFESSMDGRFLRAADGKRTPLDPNNPAYVVLARAASHEETR